MAGAKRRERCVRMTEKKGQMGFPTQENREIRLSGDRENDLVPSTVARWYDFREPGGYLGNVGWERGLN